MKPLFYQHNQTFSPWSTGGAYVHFLCKTGTHKLITGVECEFPAIRAKQIVLLDTGAELSMVDNRVYQACSYQNYLDTPVGTTTINTRLGSFEGTLHRVEVSLTADWGQPLTIEGTFLFCEHWTGPTVLGFHGFLERVRFAIDPNYEQVGGI
jgi:hypothetical protein